jgi:hypothetical protein
MENGCQPSRQGSRIAHAELVAYMKSFELVPRSEREPFSEQDDALQCA